MDRCDFCSIMTCLKNHISESNQMSQPEFLYEIFADFMDSQEIGDFSLDSGSPLYKFIRLRAKSKRI